MPKSVYVAVWNGRPIGASTHLGDVKAAAVARESQYLSDSPEYRWDHFDGAEPYDTADAQAARLVAELRAEVLNEAADFVRDAHFRDGLGVQEIGTALRYMASNTTTPKET